MVTYKKPFICNNHKVLVVDSNLVCRLQKATHSLKQAPRSWFQKLSITLCSNGFTHTKSDSSLFTKFVGHSTLPVLIYVNDIIIKRLKWLIVKILIANKIRI